ncbi:MAG: beta-lactamase family protein [Chloroflexi bacterium]|nr:beta-lactamase family protein [Chloroflexota bacterium]
MSTQSQPRRRIPVLVIVAGVILAAGIIIATRRKPEPPSLDYPPDASEAEQIAFLMEEHIVPQGGAPVHGFVLYARNTSTGLEVHQAAGTIGRSDTPLDPDYQYNIASITKPVVATIILQLMEEGALSLDDPAGQYVADIEWLRYDELHILNGTPHAADITIDHLLQHRSGLADFFLDAETRFNISVLTHPQRTFSPQRIIETYYTYGMNEVPHFAPGEGYYYSDTNYVLLGLIIEQVTGQSLPEAIRERVLEPSAMADTYFEYYEEAAGHGRRMDSFLGPINMTRYINLSYEWAGGGLVSTTTDMAAFITDLFAGAYFTSDETLALMLDNSANAAEGKTYARGINHYTLNDTIYYGHGGFYGSLLVHEPQQGVTISAHLAQATAPYDVSALMDAIVAIVTGE